MKDENALSQHHPEWITRERSMALALIVATGLALYLCYVVVQPFLPALAWALALAVIVHPIDRRIRRWISNRNLSAGVTTALAAAMIGLPVIFVTQNLAQEAAKSAQAIRQTVQSGRWRDIFERWPSLKPALPWVETQLGVSPSTKDDPQPEKIIEDSTPPPLAQPPEPANRPGVSSMQQVASVLGQRLGGMVATIVWLGMQAFITLMSLFFFLRDRHAGIEKLQSLLPLARGEADDIFRRVNDTIHATIFGSVVVAFVQGVMGGLIFWWLGLQSPLLWGTIMGLLAVVPVLGTFVIWAPTAAYLAFQGDWSKALVLVTWGGIAIGLVDNFLYPYLVGKRLRFHTLLVFFSIVGGLAAFGASGVILGPVLLATTDGLIEVWRRRTAWGGTIEGGVCETPS
jgi:predicted PurR-regulated permease PerM